MKKLILALLFLLLPCSVFAETQLAWMNPYVVGCGSLSCSESTQQGPTDMVALVDSDSFGMGNYIYMATKFVYTGTTGDLCKAYIALFRYNSPNGTTELSIYTNNAGTPDTPGTSLGSCGTINNSSLTTSAEWYGFTCNDISLVNSETYWAVAYTTNTIDGVNYLRYSMDNVCTTEQVAYSSNGSTWANRETIWCGNLKLYIKE